MNADIVLIRCPWSQVQRILQRVPDGETLREVPRRSWSNDDIRVFHSADWTILRDPELVLGTEWEAWHAISESLGTDVVSAVWETVSGSFSFALYRDGLMRREIMVSEGRVLSSNGEPLPGEPDNLAELLAEDIIAMLESAAIPFKSIESAEEVLHFGAS